MRLTGIRGMGRSPISKSLLKLCVSVPLCEITTTREIVLICFVAESFYTIYMFYPAKANPCVTMTDYLRWQRRMFRNVIY